VQDIFCCSARFVSEISAVVIPLLFGLYVSLPNNEKPYASLLSSLIYLWSIYSRALCIVFIIG
jgi:hypothetical protein